MKDIAAGAEPADLYATGPWSVVVNDGASVDAVGNRTLSRYLPSRSPSIILRETSITVTLSTQQCRDAFPRLFQPDRRRAVFRFCKRGPSKPFES